MPVVIDMAESTPYEREQYGITHRSVCTYLIRGARHNPRARFTITLWDNTIRLNPHPGQVKYNAFGSIGGDGKYLDPNNRGTDSDTSVTTSAEADVIALTPVARKPEGRAIAIDELVLLGLPDGSLLGPYKIAQRPLHDPHLEPAPL